MVEIPHHPDGADMAGGWASGACAPPRRTVADDDQQPADDLPAELVDLSLPFTQFRIEQEDGQLIMVASDGETAAVFGPGLADLNALINGAERAAEMFGRYLAMLRVRRGDRRILNMPGEAPTDVANQPPMNAGYDQRR